MDYRAEAEAMLRRAGEVAQTTPTKLDAAANVYAILAVADQLAGIQDRLEEIRNQLAP